MVTNPRALHVVGEVCARGANQELMRCRQQLDNLVAQSRLVYLVRGSRVGQVPCFLAALKKGQC